MSASHHIMRKLWSVGLMLLITPVMVGSNCAEKVSAWPLAESRCTPVFGAMRIIILGCSALNSMLAEEYDTCSTVYWCPLTTTERCCGSTESMVPVIVLGATSGCAGVELLLPPQAVKLRLTRLLKSASSSLYVPYMNGGCLVFRYVRK